MFLLSGFSCTHYIPKEKARITENQLIIKFKASHTSTTSNNKEKTRFSLRLSVFPIYFLSRSHPFDLLSQMKTVMARSSPDMSSKRHFHWTNKVGTEDGEVPNSESVSKLIQEEKKEDDKVAAPEAPAPAATAQATRRKLQALAISSLRSVLTVFGKNRLHTPFGPRVVGTLFGYRRGHVHFAFQKDPTSQPTFLIELATPISGLVREMASGLVRIALECDKEKEAEKKAVRLLEEPLWRTYCNGKKRGFATRKECGPKEWDILKAVEPISMGAGVLPGNNNGAEAGSEGELMYMRAKFERIVGSRDSEAFYMMNPDSNGAPELSIYLLRV